MLHEKLYCKQFLFYNKNELINTDWNIINLIGNDSKTPKNIKHCTKYRQKGNK